ncbi:MAG TPA: hypothetical protein VFG98_14470, partial [Intrasporangium sp.]|nr:hypothetical protein [Intrasporangium sp.]
LLVAGFPPTDDAAWLVDLRQALAELDVAFRFTASSTRRMRRLRSTRGRARALLDEIWVSTAVLEPVAGSARPGGRAPQAWWVLERLRSLRPDLAARLSLAEVPRAATMGAEPLRLVGRGVPA